MGIIELETGLQGLRFFFSGRFRYYDSAWHSREAMEEYLLHYGAVIATKFSPDVDYVVLLDSLPSKVDGKAEKLGIPVLKEADFEILVGKKFEDHERVTIPSWMDHISSGAFQGLIWRHQKYTKLKIVTLPETIKFIDNFAFQSCDNLTSINIPDGVTEIGDSVFAFCTNLKKITLPKGLKRIGDNAFKSCRSLQKIKLPEGLQEIGKEAFRDCVSLQTVAVPKSIEKVGTAAFYGCSNLSKVLIPKSITPIAVDAFRGCKGLTSPDGFLIINEYLIAAAPSETDNVVIPTGVKHIGNYVFCRSRDGKVYDSMKEMQLPAGIKSIGKGAFEYCKLLSNVIFPDGLEEISENAFLNCKGLKKAWIPDSVKVIGQSAFMGCSRIRIYASEGSCAALYAQNNGIKFTACDFDSFKKIIEKDKKTTPPSQISGEKTEEIISEFTITGERLTGYNAHEDEVVIPDNVRYVDSSAFSKNSNIRRVTIPAVVFRVGLKAFWGCTALEEVILQGNPQIYAEAFAECTSLKSFSFPAKRGNTSLPEPGMPSYPEIRKIDDEKYCNIFNRTPIGAFSGCTALEKVHLPEELFTISRETFLNCKTLNHIEIPCTVRIIESSAFLGCTSLESVDLPDGLDLICDRAFVNCSSLRGVTIPESVREIGDYAFSGCSALKSLIIQSPVREIPREAFARTDVEEVTIPEGVHVVQSSAFSGCPSLRKITILGKDTSIADEYRWEGSFRGGYKPLPFETGFSNKETLCIAAPRGSLAEEYANRYGIRFTAV